VGGDRARRRDRLAALTAEQKQRFLPLAPAFAAELRSPSDRLPPIQEKMDEYLENGTRLGWLTDTQQRQVTVYRPDRPAEMAQVAGVQEGEQEPQARRGSLRVRNGRSLYFGLLHGPEPSAPPSGRA